MPHAERDTMSQPLVNGDKPSSQFLAHLTSYPVISDSISTFKSNPYGQKSLSLADQGYSRLVAPVIPYAQRPYGYVAPYVAKADSIGDSGLSKVDEKFPIVKEDTEKVKNTVLDYAFFPLRVAGDGKNYVFNTYSGEYKKCGGDGVISGGKAIITTSLIVSSDGFAWLSTFMSTKKEQTKDVAKEAKEKVNN